LLAVERVAKGGGGHRTGAAGIFPLRFGGEAEFPIDWEFAGLAGKVGELLAERLGLCEVDVADRQVISRGKRRRQLARQRPDDPFPLALGGFEPGHPEAFGQGDLDLIFARAAFGFVGWAAHGESAGWAPAEFDARDFSLIPSLSAIEG
jgi:hypothetical protein